MFLGQHDILKYKINLIFVLIWFLVDVKKNPCYEALTAPGRTCKKIWIRGFSCLSEKSNTSAAVANGPVFTSVVFVVVIIGRAVLNARTADTFLTLAVTLVAGEGVVAVCRVAAAVGG